MTETIFALSSGSPPAAIAVMRISGPAAQQVLVRLAGAVPGPQRLSLRTLRDADGAVLDTALVAFFPAASSVTGEDLVELHLHGGRAVVAAVERILGDLPGLRAARPGEFTWRAFENGRMDLVQVEALSDLLRAETEGQRRAALAGNRLSAEVERWRQQVLMLSALVEAALDQSDEDDVPVADGRIADLAAALDAEMAALRARPEAERLHDGVRVVFAGPPNAGKSSLINALAGRDVAITSPVAGTTRDVIEAPVRIGGIAFVLTDTAGLRVEAGDAIERIGIERARARLRGADILVWLDDAAPEPEIVGEDGPELVIPVHARADLPGRETPPPGRLAVSATTGLGLGALADRLIAAARTLLPVEGEAALNRRQRALVVECHELLIAFRGEPDELIRAELLRRCRQALDALTGRAGTEEMLDALFSTFCVGK